MLNEIGWGNLCTKLFTIFSLDVCVSTYVSYLRKIWTIIKVSLYFLDLSKYPNKPLVKCLIFIILA